LPISAIERGDFEVNAFGIRGKATLIKSAAYDPKQLKILC